MVKSKLKIKKEILPTAQVLYSYDIPKIDLSHDNEIALRKSRQHVTIGGRL